MSDKFVQAFIAAAQVPTKGRNLCCLGLLGMKVCGGSFKRFLLPSFPRPDSMMQIAWSRDKHPKRYVFGTLRGTLGRHLDRSGEIFAHGSVLLRYRCEIGTTSPPPRGSYFFA